MKKYNLIARISPLEHCDTMIAGILTDSRFDTLGFNLKAIALILSSLSMLDETVSSSAPMNKSDLVRTFMDIVETFYSNSDLKVSNICQEMGISVPYFTNIFTKEMGCSPRQHIIDIRMQKAKKMLRNSDLSINEIARYAGYENPLYFTSSFHRVTGLSPTAYRRTNHQINL